MRKIFSKKGMSLFEILIVSVIAVFIMFTLLALLSSSRSTWVISDIKSDIYINARKAMNEMFDDLIEASSGNTEDFIFIDPINGQFSQGLWLASARGDSGVGGEDGSANNNYLHLDVNNVVSWRALIVYCPYENSSGIKQLRRYVDFGSSINFYSQLNIFPMTFLSVTTEKLNFIAADGVTVISIDRAGGRVLANNISTEDFNNNNVLDSNENDGQVNAPVDNEDGILNYGVNFTKNVGSIDIILFLAKKAARLQAQGLEFSTTLSNKIKFRQP
ncbi:MAG: hypothetical protein KKD05_09405 [Candidatus Omnitrophica bacterium]|nr:hypothetical protein [Candidatus Omnitrophota bacterium]